MASPSMPGPGTSDPVIQSWQQARNQVQDILKPAEYQEVLKVQSAESMLDAINKKTQWYQRRRLPRFMARVQPAIDQLRSLAGVVDTFIQTNPTTSGLIWGSLKLVLELASRSAELFERVASKLNNVCIDLPRYNLYSELFPDSERLRASLVNIFCKLIHLNCLFIVYLRRHPIRNLFSAASIGYESRFDSVISEIQTYIKRLEKEANVSFMQLNKLGFDDLRMLYAHKPTQRVAQLPCYVIPFAENHGFFGRIDALKGIRDTFRACRASSSQGSVVLHGLGGIGKTEISLHFVYTLIHAGDQNPANREYDAIFWINAENPERISQAYIDIARRLGLSDGDTDAGPRKCQELVFDWLENTDHKWLIVFDNANRDLALLEESWPSGHNGAILITTRSNDLAHRFSTTASIEVEEFDPVDRVAFFRSLFSKSPKNQQLLDDPSQVQKIVDMFDGLAFALNQVAGYMLTSNCSSSKFTRIYSNPDNAKQLHEEETIGSTSHYRRTIANVWAISISDLDEKAKLLLEVLSFLDPDGVSEQLLQERPESGDEIEFQGAVKSLSRHSLIKYNEASASLSVHRLVQTASLQLFELDRRQEGFLKAQAVIQSIFPDTRNRSRSFLKDMSAQYESVLPHIVSIDRRYQKMRQDLSPPNSLGPLLERIVSFLFYRGSMRTALSLRDLATETCETFRGTEPFLLMNLYRTYGSIYRNSNMNSEGHEMYLRALTICLDAEESTERDRNIAMMYGSLGNTALALNRVDESLGYHLDGIHFREKHAEVFSTDEDREDLAIAWINAGWAYLQQGQLQEASDVLERSTEVLREFERAAENPTGEVSFGLRVLGNVRIAQSRHDEAFAMHQEAFRIQVECFGYGHHETGDLCYKLAYHYHRRDHKEDAIRLLREALAVYAAAADEVEVTGALARTKYRLALLLTETGDEKAALIMKEEAASLRKALTGLEPGHQDDLLSYELLVPYWGR